MRKLLKKRVAVLGGGLTGLATAYHLANKYDVTLIEKEKKLGGLASGFKQKNWEWPLEKSYHHLFSNDSDIIKFSHEIGFEKIFFKKPITASLYQEKNGFRILPLDTPFDFLRFPYLSFFEKIRSGAVLAFLKISPSLAFYEKITAQDFLKKTMGKNAWNKLWQQLFRKKFGYYAGIILSVFIWARIKKRTKSLGYFKGGFQSLIDYLENSLKKKNVKIIVNHEIKSVEKRGDGFEIDGLHFEKIICTLPTSTINKIAKKVLPESFLVRFEKLKYLHAVTLIIETESPILEKNYWLNINADNIPIMIIAQHTNFINKKYYGGNHIAYLGWYVEKNHPLIKMNKNRIKNMVLPYLEKISGKTLAVKNIFLFKSPFAQPIFDKDFVKNKPGFITPVQNFFIANLDMTYPYDRGTNYAVKLGKTISDIIL